MANESNEARALVWDKLTGSWTCWNCNHTEFTQMIIAENYVTLISGDATTMIESDDFQGSWEVTNRGAIICENCRREVSLPDFIETLERCVWDGRR